jgi:hypothetical protein
MRCSRLLALTTACALFGLPTTGAAQDRADTTTVVDSTIAVDSSEIADTLDDSDSVEVRRPTGRSPGGNPYLREVVEEDEQVVEKGEAVEEDAKGEVVEEEKSVRRGGRAYGTFGLGFGSEAIATLGAPGPYSPTRTRPTLDIGLGFIVGSALRIGVDGFIWFNAIGNGALETVTAAMLAARVYPIPGNGLYLRAAGGLGRYGQDLLDDHCGCSGPLIADYGLAYALGAGFELPVGRGLWLGPMVEMVRFDVGGPGGYRERVLTFGLSLTVDGSH